jgi:1-aminocyclopropane-1-carboxylate deaminase/D-cysteine desulfhydrase-like pyridoxal-dependent ACC family enzyme
MKLGTYPTPVDRLSDALGPGRDLWVKRDDLTSARYGGNKVRKLERVLEVAQAQGAKRIVTVGGAGSHHVLATAIYAADVGIEVEAILVPQPRTPHVTDNLRAIAARARIWPASSFTHAGTIIADRVACGAYYVPPGGSTSEATLAYADAATELLAQVAREELPEPAVVVVTLGSGGTAAGLSAGFAAAGSAARVVAVAVSQPMSWVRWQARRSARLCLGTLAPSGSPAPLRLEIVEGYLGRGYGYATPECERALADAAHHGLALDTTYTAKTFAAVLELPSAADPILYWHTLSSAPMAPLLVGAPTEENLPPDVRALLLPVRERT